MSCRAQLSLSHLYSPIPSQTPLPRPRRGCRQLPTLPLVIRPLAFEFQFVYQGTYLPYATCCIFEYLPQNTQSLEIPLIAFLLPAFSPPSCLPPSSAAFLRRLPMERQPNAPSLPASALSSSLHNRYLPRAKLFESTDAAFSVSWLLGLQPPPPPPPHVQAQAVARNPPEWAKHLSTADPTFSVSWLLGLQPRPATTGPPWAKQYQTDDADFLVSRLLGLIPASGALLQKRSGKLLNVAGSPSEAGTSTTSSESDADSENVDWQHDFNEAGYFLAQLYGDCPYVDDDSEDDSGTDDSSQAVHDSVTLDPEFLDLCERLEDLLDEIE